MKPNINIYNYEEYFLLYADGELSVEEMAAVVGFVKEHPELQPALDTLLHSRLSVDDKVVFADKGSLFKTDEAGITLDNYEEYFLLYVDDELNGEQKTETEKFVLQHPALQSEFTLLKQTLLPKEAIVFAGKENLYRKDAAGRPVVSIGWKRFAVAASVAGLVFAVWNFYPKAPNVVKQPVMVAKAEPGTESKNSKASISRSSPTVANKNNPTANNRREDIAAVAHLQKNSQVPKVIPVSNVDAADTKVSGNNDFVIEDEPKISRDEIAIVESKKTVQLMRMIKQLPDNRKVVNTGTKTIIKEVRSSNEENDNALYVANVQISKNKIPNILKRARSILHFNGSDDNGIAIANFSISR